MHISGFSNKFFSEIVIRRQAPGPLLSYCTLTYLTLTQNQRFDIKISQKLDSFKPIKNGFKFYGLKTNWLKRTVFGNYGFKIRVKCNFAKYYIFIILAKRRVPKILHVDCYLFGKLGNIIIEGFCGSDVSGRPISGRI